MDILIPDSWLKKYLDTKATPSELAKYLSLCGPSIERAEKFSDGDPIYSIEVTTNRVDTASVLGIAREAQAILPRFGIKAKLKNSFINTGRFKFVKKIKYLDATVDSNLCPRFTAVLIKNVAIKNSPKEVSSLLEKIGVRPINNIVDVTNFIMHELGQPVHTFDYDKIKGAKMILGLSNGGEEVTTLDGKTFKLKNSDIVIKDGGGRIIDLCGIMGGENSMVDINTRNVLLFVQTYDRHRIRQTSMRLSQRSEAAVLFEKGLDPEMVKQGMFSAISMIEKLSGGKASSEILDIYPFPYKEKYVVTNLETLEKIIGIKLNKKDISEYLDGLGFGISWDNNNLKIKVPSFRANDIDIPEDIAEEVARIYGYHNLPNILMSGDLPKPTVNILFKIEGQIKQILKALGGIEILNLSLVGKDIAGENALKLRNPMGSDTEYLRTVLMPSLIQDVVNNPQEEDKIHFFELSNTYLPIKNSLPEEKLVLAGIIKSGEYRENKGVVEVLLNELKINYQTKVEDGKNYLPSQRSTILSDKKEIGQFGNLECGLFYYEFDVERLINAKKVLNKYHEIPKYPPQIEDHTFILPERTRVGEVVDIIKKNALVSNVELSVIYKNSYTFRIWYQDKTKTLTDMEVEKLRNKIISEIKTKFGAQIRE